MVLREANKNDLVLIYYSGHGKLNPAGKLHLTSTNTVINALESTSIPVSTIKNYVDVSLSNKIVLILDCCFSGAAGEAFARGGVDDQLQLISGGRGTCIMTASTGIQVAQEKESDQYGVFTKHLIEGIKSGEADLDSDGLITMADLYRYVHDKVLDEGFQEPMKWDLNVRGELVIARSGKTPRGERRKQIREILFDLAKSFLPDDIFDKARQVNALDPDQFSEGDRKYDRLLDQLLNKSLEPVEFIRKWDRVRRRQEEEGERREDEQRKVKEEWQRLEEEKQRLAEQKSKLEEDQKRKEAAHKAEEERKRKEIEARRKIEEESKLKEEEQKQREAEAKLRAAEKEQQRKEEVEERKRREEEQRLTEAAHKAEKEFKKKEIETKHKTETELKSRKLKAVIKPLKSETTTTKPQGKIIVGTWPKDANVKFLDNDQTFQQGMELESGRYHLEVSSEGYKTERRWIDIGPGEENRNNFKLEKTTPEVGKLHAETAPEFEEERQKKEEEAKRKADEKKRRKEKEELKRKSDEEERKRKESEAKRQAEEERKNKEIEAKRKKKEAEAKRKAETPGYDYIYPFLVAVGVLLIFAILYYITH